MLRISLVRLANVPGVSILSLLTPINLPRVLNWKAAVSVNGKLNQQREMYTPPINISTHSAITTVELKFALFRRSLVRKEHGGTPPPSPDEGRSQPIAAKVLMKMLYSARLCRFDVLRAVCHLATFVTKWTSECDRKLRRLVCYIHSSKHLRMIGWVGDKRDALQPHFLADADFAGCTASQKSTSGYHFIVRGPHSCFPIRPIPLIRVRVFGI